MDKYISREELIEEIEEEIAIGDKFDEKDVLINKGLKIALKYIKRQASADVQPVKHGLWITAHPVDVAKEFKCTACGGLIELPVFAKRCYYDYCPNCGARMGLKDGEKHA